MTDQIQTLISEWDGENVIVRFDRPTGAWIVIAIHSSRLGPATGGTRMQSYRDLESALGDALRLAEGMTYKYAVPGMARGGGKAVIHLTRRLNPDERAGLLRRYGELLQRLGGYFQTGPDVGTSPDDMNRIAETGSPYVFCRTPAAGGAGSSGPLTALTVFTGIEAACEHLFGDRSLEGRVVLVQGVGSVGGNLIPRLRAAGARVIFSDVDETLIRRYQQEQGLEFVAGEEVYAMPCDIYSPCALGGVLNAGTIPLLECRAVAGGANNQLDGAGMIEALRDKGILYLPDFVVNVGGAMGITGIEAMGWTEEEAQKRVVDSVRDALRRILALAGREKITTEAAARRIAELRLSAGGVEHDIRRDS